MRVLGVDPGLTRCGIGVIDSLPGRRLSLVDSGLATTPAGETPDRRLLSMAEQISAWMDRCQPDAVAVERVFAQQNLLTVTATAQVAGLVMVEAARRGIEVGLHTPTEVKAAVTGSGGAAKAQIAGMVRRLLVLETNPTPADTADALALAICHAWRPSTLHPTGQASTAAQKAWVEAERAARARNHSSQAARLAAANALATAGAATGATTGLAGKKPASRTGVAA